MPRPKSYPLTMTASVANAVCDTQTPLAAGALTIDGTLATAGVATLDVPRHLLLTAGGADSARTLTITGTDRHNRALSVAAICPSSTTKIIEGYNFKTITGVSVDAATASTLRVGTADSLEGPWIPLDWAGSGETLVDVALSASADLTYAVHSTVSNVQSPAFTEQDAAAVAVATVTGTASAQKLLTGSVRAIRLAVSEWTAGTATLAVLERPNR